MLIVVTAVERHIEEMMCQPNSYTPAAAFASVSLPGPPRSHTLPPDCGKPAPPTTARQATMVVSTHITQLLATSALMSNARAATATPARGGAAKGGASPATTKGVGKKARGARGNKAQAAGAAIAAAGSSAAPAAGGAPAARAVFDPSTGVAGSHGPNGFERLLGGNATNPAKCRQANCGASHYCCVPLQFQPAPTSTPALVLGSRRPEAGAKAIAAALGAKAGAAGTSGGEGEASGPTPFSGTLYTPWHGACAYLIPSDPAMGGPMAIPGVRFPPHHSECAHPAPWRAEGYCPGMDCDGYLLVCPSCRMAWRCDSGYCGTEGTGLPPRPLPFSPSFVPEESGLLPGGAPNSRRTAASPGTRSHPPTGAAARASPPPAAGFSHADK